MKIGIDVSLLSSQYDGIGVYIYNSLEYLGENSSEHEFYLYSNLPLFRVPELNDRFHLRIDNKPGHLAWLLTTLPKRIAADKLDAFWQPNFILPFRVKGVKNVVTIHDLSAYAYTEFSSTKANITHRLLLGPTCRKAHKILAISNNCKNEIVKYLKVPPEKITTIYNGKKMFDDTPADPEKSQSYLEQISTSKGEYLLFVGTMSPRKNDVVLVKGYFDYRRRGGTKKLVLAGSFAEKSLPVKEMIEASEYREDIMCLGFVSDEEKKILYYNAAMLLYPSRLEGFGFPLLEGMQARIPVITANVSCMPEIAEDAALYLNNIDDPSELADRIFEAEALTPERREKMIAKGLARVEFFDGLDYRKQTLEAIQDTCK
ncbi:MAG: glycosyltransferase family 4 protein [Oscillospiraceae bacterium]|nr:glycosyltransferase family 4 protein [Oscillospiraceae bacterium]